jgi:hypothetical protein
MRIKNKEIRRRRQRKEQIIKADQRELRAKYGDKKVVAGEKAAPKPKAAPAAKKASAAAAAPKPAAPKKAAAPKKKADAPAE